MHFTVTFAGPKNIVRYTEEFVKSRFHYSGLDNTQLQIYLFINSVGLDSEFEC